MTHPRKKQCNIALTPAQEAWLKASAREGEALSATLKRFLDTVIAADSVAEGGR